MCKINLYLLKTNLIYNKTNLIYNKTNLINLYLLKNQLNPQQNQPNPFVQNQTQLNIAKPHFNIIYKSGNFENSPYGIFNELKTLEAPKPVVTPMLYKVDQPKKINKKFVDTSIKPPRHIYRGRNQEFNC